MNYQLIYEQIIKNGKQRELNGYVEIHHIIPNCVGGTDDDSNLVRLTAKEHFIVHKLLYEIHPNEHKLQRASWMMMTMKSEMGRNYHVGAREYQRLRENLTVGDETRRKMSISAKNKPKMSDETRKKLSKPKPVGFGEIISKRLNGKSKSKEHILNLSKARTEYYKHNKHDYYGRSGIWTDTQIRNNRNNQPTVRKVDQFTLDGDFVKTWDSITETRIICSGVPHCLMGTQQTSGGFMWKYNDNKPPNTRRGGKTKNK